MALDQWRLTLGGREDWVHTGTQFINKGDATNTQRDKAFSGNAALSYVFDSGFVPYLSYAESFQPTSGADATSTGSLKPTEGKQWELGIKYQPPGSKTLLSAAVYDLTQKNVAVNSIVNNVTITSQTGEVKVKGLELEAVSDVTDNLKVIAAYTLAKSEVQKGVDKGNRLQLMPNQQASLWTDYTWHSGVLDGFGIGGGVRYTGNTYGDKANTWLGKADAYTVFDARCITTSVAWTTASKVRRWQLTPPTCSTRTTSPPATATTATTVTSAASSPAPLTSGKRVS